MVHYINTIRKMSENKQVIQKMKWDESLLAIGIIIGKVLCQWCRVEFLIHWTNLYPATENHILVPIILAVLEALSILFLICYSSSANEMSMEGVYLWSIFQIQWTFLFVFNHSSDLSLLPDLIGHCGPLIALILYRICNRKFPEFIETCGCILLSVGSIFFFENILKEIKTPTIPFLISFSLMGRNECLKQLSLSGIQLIFHARNICSSLAIVMFLLFILGFLISRKILSFFVIGISSALTSLLFTFFTWKAISRNISVLYISMLCSISDLIINYYYFLYHFGESNDINVFGAALYFLGIYFLSRGSGFENNLKLDFDKERQSDIYLQMEFLLCICDIVGIFSYFFKPKISGPDERIVGYFELSFFARWLKQRLSYQ